MTSPDTLQRKQQAEDARKNILDLDLRFYSHLTLLSGGTLTLLVPFVQSVQGATILKSKFLMHYGGIFLIISLILSTGTLYMVRQLGHEHWKQFTGERDRSKFVTTLKQTLGQLALISYTVGLIFFAFFVNANLI